MWDNMTLEKDQRDENKWKHLENRNKGRNKGKIVTEVCTDAYF